MPSSSTILNASLLLLLVLYFAFVVPWRVPLDNHDTIDGDTIPTKDRRAQKRTRPPPRRRPRSRPDYPPALAHIALLSTWLVCLLQVNQAFPAPSTVCPPPPPPPVCPAPPILPQGDSFDWILQLPRMCSPISGPGAEPWALFGVPLNLSNTWQDARAPNDTESKVCLRRVRRGYRKVRALWHTDRAAVGRSSDHQQDSWPGPGTATTSPDPMSTPSSRPTSIPGLGAMFNLSDRQLLVVATLIDDVYVTAKFQCLRNDQKSRYLDVLADAEDLDIDDMTVDPLPPPRDPDDAMDMHDPDYFRVYFLSEKLGQPFHVIAHSFRKLRRIGQHWILGVDRDQDFEGFEDFEEWRKKAEQDWARSHRRQSHLARLMNDPRLKHRSKPEWERNYERPKNPKDEK